MKQQFVKNRRSGEFGYRLDTETGDAGGDGFDSVVGVKKTCKVEFLKISHRYSNSTRLVRTDKCFVSFSTCNPNTCSHWLTQSQNEADIYYLFIIG